MLNLKETEHTKTKLKHSQHANLRTVHMSAYHCAQLWYTTQQRTLPIIFPLNLQMIIIHSLDAMPSIGGEGEITLNKN